MVEIVTGAAPTTIDGTPLDHKCLHCYLSIPVQHFMERNPEKTREQLIREACELVAELVNSCGYDWSQVRPYGELAMDVLSEQIQTKFKAHDRARRGRN